MQFSSVYFILCYEILFKYTSSSILEIRESKYHASNTGIFTSRSIIPRIKLQPLHFPRASDGDSFGPLRSLQYNELKYEGLAIPAALCIYNCYIFVLVHRFKSIGCLAITCFLIEILHIYELMFQGWLLSEGNEMPCDLKYKQNVSFDKIIIQVFNYNHVVNHLLNV